MSIYYRISRFFNEFGSLNDLFVEREIYNNITTKLHGTSCLSAIYLYYYCYYYSHNHIASINVRPLYVIIKVS